MNRDHKVQLTNEEFIFLSSLLNASPLIGVPDLFFGYWVDTLESKMKRAEKSLLQKGYLHQSKSKFQMDAVVKSYMTTCKKANTALWLQQEKSGQEKESYYYTTPSHIVQSIVYEQGERLSYELFQKSALWHIQDEFMQNIAPTEKPMRSEGSFFLPMTVLCSLIEERAAKSVRSIEGVLKQEGVRGSLAKAFAKAIKSYETYERVTVFQRAEEKWTITAGIQLLSDTTANWMIRVLQKEREEIVEIQTVSLAAFSRELVQLVEVEQQFHLLS